MAPGRPLPPVYFLAGLIAMLALHFALPLARIIGPPWRYAGAVPVLAGVVLNLWANGLFKRHGTEVKPFRDSSTLVVEGPYRLSRNPMYLGGLVALAGAGILLGSVTPFLAVAVMAWLATAHFIVPEERDLERQFGERYLEYKRRVRRWM
jgi:protein-S-isoprenylcysteine O-methyltransferase Ste14